MVNNTTHDSSIKDVSNSDTKPDADESRLPVTRRSVLKGAASIGPVAGLVGSGVAADEASAAQGKGHDAGPVTVQSPDENIKATIKQRSPNRIGDDLPPGRVVSLTVSRDGTRVLDPSPLGLKTYTGQFVTSLSLEAQDVRTIEHTFETVGGDQAGEQTIHARFATLVYGSPSGVMKIDLLVSNEGIAYRYRLPGDGHVIVAGEASAFQIPEDSAGWLLPYTDKYEKVWEEKDAKSASALSVIK
jgi:alpha-glucosidase